MPKLVFIDPRFAGRSYEFVREKSSIGRADDNLLVIRDPSISSHHCEIIVNGEEVIVRDLKSRNGTFVNGERLQDQQRQVRDGGRVRFGTVEACVEIEPADTRDDSTAITAIYSHKQAMAQGPRPAVSADPGMRLEPDAAGETAEKTILMPHDVAPASPPSVTPASGAPASPGRRGGAVWLVVGLVLAAGLVAWVLWLRK